MKAAVVASALAQGALALAPGYGNGNNFGPDRNMTGWGGFGGGFPGGFGGFGHGPAKCAASCFSSHWATATPTPAAFCSDAPALKSCVSSACATETAALSKWSSVSSSACKAFTDCATKSTFTYSGGWWATKTDDAVTMTGCPVDGFWGPGGAWGGMGPGWAYKTETDIVTRTISQDGRVITTVGPQTVAQAVSGSSTLRTTFAGAFAAQETGTTTNAAAGVDRSVKVAGVCLGAAVAVVGLM
ncbi:hypothetical protein CkaCkLH20_02884 [Colletotrichum karsti]|uniref:Extracellular membrane protein CFEM domain-containing protein n=1 Tax=Colletotrichum karsti TaxID=1095194 RepID=A0A9P6ICK2_9PEZI|nr:uncharacterized protein CkaCkLH20_02884 [Colletotrichum karsti]KAF9879341.1 hypothetical protein CkaCkLH20_02884 [Colletotrichum karsti]